ncbi:MAG: hypothetical protein HW416_3239, partial [Chloroflexi bacterium]|nr:hypothetical protein [Chloroflexota bacterium]
MLLGLIVFALLTACAPPQTSQRAGNDAVSPASPQRKRITAAIMGNPSVIVQKLNSTGGGRVPGVGAVEMLLHAGLAQQDSTSVLRPRLAEDVPSAENGLWRVFPDGSMETTWRLKPSARWHDGVPITSADLAFTMAVVRDKALSDFGDVAYAFIESVDAPDPRTITVRWKEPFIEADTLFTVDRALPMPRHLLEEAYAADRAAFTQHAYWSQGFVGAGPYRLRDWESGSHLVLEAFDDYVLGRPRIDEIEVRFIPDPAALSANVVGNAVDVTLGGGLSLEQALGAVAQWRDGSVVTKYNGWIVGYPQLLSPTPAVQSNLEFRRALIHAVDRDEMAASLMAGRSFAADSFLSPDTREYADTRGSAVLYPYDPRRAAQLVEGLGFARGVDGTFADAAGQKLVVDIQTTAAYDIQVKSTLALADYWQRIGVGTSQDVLPPQRVGD